MKIKKGYSFDDLFLVPKFSSIPSRSDKYIDLSVDLGKGVKLQNPLISANMKSISSPKFIGKLASLGGLAIHHRFDNDILQDFNDSINWYLTFKQQDVSDVYNHIGISIGLEEREFNLLDKYALMSGKVVCIDVAHGHHQRCMDVINKISEKYPQFLLIAGNVATSQGAFDLWWSGANVIKVGIGSGSLCSTRIETGNGVPQMTVLDDVKTFFDTTYFMDNDDRRLPLPKIISDGGMRSAGDVVKSLCFADAVMLGNMFAGTNETPGEVVIFGGKKYKQYAGSSTHKNRNVEGVVGLVPTRGSLEEVVTKILEGVRSGCSYQGVSNLNDLKWNPEFVEVSNAGLLESRPHDIVLG